MLVYRKKVLEIMPLYFQNGEVLRRIHNLSHEEHFIFVCVCDCV